MPSIGTFWVSVVAKTQNFVASMSVAERKARSFSDTMRDMRASMRFLSTLGGLTAFASVFSRIGSMADSISRAADEMERTGKAVTTLQKALQGMDISKVEKLSNQSKAIAIGWEALKVEAFNVVASGLSGGAYRLGMGRLSEAWPEGAMNDFSKQRAEILARNAKLDEDRKDKDKAAEARRELEEKWADEASIAQWKRNNEKMASRTANFFGTTYDLFAQKIGYNVGQLREKFAPMISGAVTTGRGAMDWLGGVGAEPSRRGGAFEQWNLGNVSPEGLWSKKQTVEDPKTHDLLETVVSEMKTLGVAQ